MNKNRLYLSLFCVFFAITSCQKTEEKKEEEVVVTEYVVQYQSIPNDFRFIGTIQSSHMVEIRSRVEGYLQNIAYTEGATVKEGDLLFEIDPRELQDAVREAEANLEREKAILWQAKQALERYKPLFNQKAASKKDLDDANTAVLSAEASVNVYQAKLDQAKLNLSYASIKSPISGVTTNYRFSEGTLITPSANGFLTTVSVIDPVWIEINVAEKFFSETLKDVDANELIVPSKFNFDVSVVLDDGTLYPEKGKVSFVSPVYDQSTGTFAARAVMKNPDFRLKPGQFVDVLISGAIRPHAIIIPQESVLLNMTGHYVYVINKENKVESRSIVVGNWYKDFWIVKSGLKNGDRIIRQGASKVKVNSKVKVVS
jgi:membrane fusion protein (multidrug efflux system)